MFKNKLIWTFFLLIGSFVIKFLSDFFLQGNLAYIVQLVVIVLVFIFGFYILHGTAEIIEETTGVLSEKTGVAGGVLQSFGTAFPDMALGVVAAVLSLSLRKSDYSSSINYAIIAAATTFGSNIYNVGFSAWCVFRQNLANELGKRIWIFPLFNAGAAIPIEEHMQRPSHKEMDVSISVITALSVLTSLIAISMVIFGKVTDLPQGISGDLYQLIRPIGIFVFIVAVAMIFLFRKSERITKAEEKIINPEDFFRKNSLYVIWISLIVSAAAILYSAEAMIHALKIFSDMTNIPFVLTGVAAGIIGSLGEMLVVYNFTVNPKGRIGDAIVGVAMDNIVTIIGASIVAMIGGIFLGGNALILIFVIILCLDTILIWQISRLKDRLPE